MKDIAIYGAGGFGREVACLIRLINENLDRPRWNFIGFFDDDEAIAGTFNEHGKVLGGRERINQWPTPVDVVIAIGTPQVIKDIAEGIDKPMVDFPNVIAPNVTWLDKDKVKMGKGNLICSGCLISCNVEFGNFNVLNGFSPIGHDTTIGDYNVIMPSCNISGGVRMGDCNFFGVKSAILQYLKIGNNTRVGAGSVVMRNTKDGYLYVGIPAKRIEL